MHLPTSNPTLLLLLTALLTTLTTAASLPPYPRLLPRQANTTTTPWTLSFYGGPACADPSPIDYAANTGGTNGCAAIGHGAGSAVVNDPGWTTNWYRDPGCVTHVEVEIIEGFAGGAHCDTPYGDAAGYFSYYEVVPK